MLRRRQLLAASITTVPAFLVLSGCAGPDPLAGPPPLSPDVRGLLAAVTAETNLVFLYNECISVYSGLAPTLRPLLAEHEAHLAQLRSRIIEPPGKSVPTKPSARPRVTGSQQGAVTSLSAAERSAVTANLHRLLAAAPDLAQLYASIAASEATHVTALAGLHQ
jgi:hypothetical protein